MPDSHKNKIIGLVILVFVAVFTVPILVDPGANIKTDGGSRAPTSWRQTIYDFQTIFGGALAVVAAAITVYAMYEIEKKQAGRHEELLKLQARPENLRIERAVNPQTEDLNRAGFTGDPNS